MPIMDVFLGDAFTARSLTSAVDRYGYAPKFLETINGLFIPKSVRTKEVWIEERDYTPSLIKTSAIGAPPEQRGGDQRKARSFQTSALAVASRIWAYEIQNVRAFGEEASMKDLQLEVARRQMKMKEDMSITKENMRLGCVQGIVYDADGNVIYNWYDEFGQSAPSERTFDFTSSATEGDIRKLANTIKRRIIRNLKGLGGSGVVVHALCGDEFWDGLITSAEVRHTYQAQMALQLQNDVGNVWEKFLYAGIMWCNYRGTDDNSTVAVGSKKVKFFPVGAPIFQAVHSPAPRNEFVFELGQEFYTWMVPDKDRDQWVDVEQYSYPLYICTMPQALDAGKIN